MSSAEAVLWVAAAFVAYPYLVYPLWLFLAGRRLRRRAVLEARKVDAPPGEPDRLSGRSHRRHQRRSARAVHPDTTRDDARRRVLASGRRHEGPARHPRQPGAGVRPIATAR